MFFSKTYSLKIELKFVKLSIYYSANMEKPGEYQLNIT